MKLAITASEIYEPNTVAMPVISDMLGCRCELNFARGGCSTVLIATATITEMYPYRGQWFFVVESDNVRLSGRHFSEVEFEESLIRYIYDTPYNGMAMEVAVAVKTETTIAA